MEGIAGKVSGGTWVQMCWKVKKSVGQQRNDMEVEAVSYRRGDDALIANFLSQCFAKHLTTINIENSHWQLYQHYHGEAVLFCSAVIFNVFGPSSLQKYSKQQILSNSQLQPQSPLLPLPGLFCPFPDFPLTLAQRCLYFLYLLARTLHLLS